MKFKLNEVKFFYQKSSSEFDWIEGRISVLAHHERTRLVVFDTLNKLNKTF